MIRTLTIDDAANGGSDAGAWALAIAHTPHLAAQIYGFARDGIPTATARDDVAGLPPLGPATSNMTAMKVGDHG